MLAVRGVYCQKFDCPFSQKLQGLRDFQAISMRFRKCSRQLLSRILLALVQHTMKERFKGKTEARNGLSMVYNHLSFINIHQYWTYLLISRSFENFDKRGQLQIQIPVSWHSAVVIIVLLAVSVLRVLR